MSLVSELPTHLPYNDDNDLSHYQDMLREMETLVTYGESHKRYLMLCERAIRRRENYLSFVTPVTTPTTTYCNPNKNCHAIEHGCLAAARRNLAVHRDIVDRYLSAVNNLHDAYCQALHMSFEAGDWSSLREDHQRLLPAFQEVKQIEELFRHQMAKSLRRAQKQSARDNHKQRHEHDQDSSQASSSSGSSLSSTPATIH